MSSARPASIINHQSRHVRVPVRPSTTTWRHPLCLRPHPTLLLRFGVDARRRFLWPPLRVCASSLPRPTSELDDDARTRELAPNLVSQRAGQVRQNRLSWDPNLVSQYRYCPRFRRWQQRHYSWFEMVGCPGARGSFHDSHGRKRGQCPLPLGIGMEFRLRLWWFLLAGPLTDPIRSAFFVSIIIFKTGAGGREGGRVAMVAMVAMDENEENAYFWWEQGWGEQVMACFTGRFLAQRERSGFPEWSIVAQLGRGQRCWVGGRHVLF